jgi:nucleoside-diphosphate-sugar epimerase
MLRNVLDAIEPVARGLEHVHLVQGTKYYGMHLGPFRTPAEEDDPRHPPPNFYYDQQDLLVARQRGQRWNWSASRPTFIYDFAPERARNAVSVIGAYAAIVRELGEPLDFPGSPAAFDAQRDMTDASLLARAMVFIATTSACANQAFNVNNGDLFRWRTLWPKIAEHFGMPTGRVRPMKLSDWIEDKQPVWANVVRRHGLIESHVDEIADWHFADFHWAHGYDICSSPAKLNATGFCETLDSEEVFLRCLLGYREAKVLP